jgi:ribosome assembly protein 1
MSTSIFPEPARTRLVTIIAQVDHGKTTLADSLIESNGIISERLAGTLRYLDDLEEEQRRGITMRTSAIGLSHSYQAGGSKNANEPQQMVIHLLDSPGHADFCTEVSSALQCCDGALLVVDAVEGLCARTHQVLREAFVHELIPILVINKVDRLCTELCLSPEEAYMRLRKLLESMNAASAAMLNSSRANNATDGGESNTKTATTAEEDEAEEEAQAAIWTFDAAKGNVVFCSAIHGWGFTVPSLARQLFRSKTLDIKPPVLRQYLFGDFKFKGGKVLKWKPDTASEMPMFAEFGLNPIWQIYQGVSEAAMASGLGSNLFGNSTTNNGVNSVKITAATSGMDQVQVLLGSDFELQEILKQTGSSTEDAILRSVLRRYRPLSTNVLNAVCDKCPSPASASKEVRTRALALQAGAAPEVQAAVSECNVEGPAVAHVCKFLITDKSNVRDAALAEMTQGDTLLMGVTRVLSGTLQAGDAYYCMGPKHHESETAPQRSVRLYLLMGSSLVPVDKVPAGHLCAIYGLEDLQLKTVTLSSSPDAMPLQGFDQGIRPLVKVNVEPENAEDTDALERGLVKLTLADAAVEVTATSKGERILACLGEIHLEQSLLDLETVYCGKAIKLRKSEPIVEFGETTTWMDGEADYPSFAVSTNVPPLRQTAIPPYNEEEGVLQARRGRMRALLSGRSAAIGVRVVPLADSVYEAFKTKELKKDCHEEVIKLGNALGCSGEDIDIMFAGMLETLRSVDANGNALLESKGISNGSCVKGVVGDEVYSVDLQAQGKEESEEGNVGLEEHNLFLDCIRDGGLLSKSSEQDDGGKTSEANEAALNLWRTQMSGSITAGFQLGLRAGPICEEPVHHVLVILESIEVALSSDRKTPSKSLSGGMVIGALKQGIRCALLSRPARLMEGHLKLTLHSSLAGLGSLYGVLSKRRGKVLEDSMVDGTDLLLITATLPQAESFGLAPELLRKTSGEVTVPELTFWKWTRLEEDPFWIPTSLEEREDFGEIIINGDASTGVDNTALKYIRLVRERKGLLVDSARTVIAAEKQRTMKR